MKPLIFPFIALTLLLGANSVFSASETAAGEVITLAHAEKDSHGEKDSHAEKGNHGEKGHHGEKGKHGKKGGQGEEASQGEKSTSENPAPVVDAVTANKITAGKAKTMACVSCHGQNGMAVVGMYPNLAGQNEAYLISALKAYRNNERTGGMATIMQMQAARLTDADIDNIAAYYSSLK